MILSFILSWYCWCRGWKHLLKECSFSCYCQQYELYNWILTLMCSLYFVVFVDVDVWADILSYLRLLCASFLFLMCWMLERRGYELCSGGCWAELRIKENPPPRPTHLRPGFNIVFFSTLFQHMSSTNTPETKVWYIFFV